MIDGMFKVSFGIDVSGGMITFTMDDGGSGAVRKRDDGSYALVVPRGEERSFQFSLCNQWQWTFDDGNATGLTFKSQEDAKYYKVEKVDARTLIIHARPTGEEMAVHRFNIYVAFGQKGGNAVACCIDPEVDNPPFGGGG